MTWGRPRIEVTLKQARTTSGILGFVCKFLFSFSNKSFVSRDWRVLRNGVRVLGLVRGGAVGGAVGGYAQIMLGEP